tara:strand:- start:46345 stop:46728 length:384 start_codon:yes stop_codon:yes gene_type:complete
MPSTQADVSSVRLEVSDLLARFIVLHVVKVNLKLTIQVAWSVLLASIKMSIQVLIASLVQLASTLGQLVRQQQAHAKTVIVANIPRQRRLHVQIAQQTPSLQSVLLPVQIVLWVKCFTFNIMVGIPI